MANNKMKSSFTGVDFFHYKVLNDDAGVKTPERIEGLN